MWWKDVKMRICLGVGIILLLVVIIVPAGMSILFLGPAYDTIFTNESYDYSAREKIK